MRTDRLRSILIVLAYAYAALMPFSVAMGSIFSGLLIVGGLVLLALDPEARANVDRPMVIALAGIIVWLAVATAFASPHPVKWKDWGQLLWLKLHVITAATILFGQPRHAGRVLAVLILATVVVAALGIGQHFTGRLPFEDEIPPMRGDLWEIEGYFGHHLTYAGHVMVVWLVALALVVSSWGRTKRRRLALAAGAVAMLSLALFWSYARSPQIGALGGAIALATTLPRKARFGIAIVLVLAVVSALASPQMRVRFGKMTDLSTEETRLNLWESSWSGIQERPWTGYGPGNFGSMLRGHEVEGFYNARSHAHNDWIQHAVVMGLPGLAFAMAFFVTMALALRRRLGSPGMPSWIIPAAFAALVGMALAGMFQVFDSDDEVEMTLFFVVGCGLSATVVRHGNGRTTSVARPDEPTGEST